MTLIKHLMTSRIICNACIAGYKRFNEIEILQINLTYLSEMMKLPLYHQDPFDRLIIAQGISEKLPLIARDEAFKNYPIDIIW